MKTKPESVISQREKSLKISKNSMVNSQFFKETMQKMVHEFKVTLIVL